MYLFLFKERSLDRYFGQATVGPGHASSHAYITSIDYPQLYPMLLVMRPRPASYCDRCDIDSVKIDNLILVRAWYNNACMHDECQWHA
jgi:hypothetical protein